MGTQYLIVVCFVHNESVRWVVRPNKHDKTYNHRQHTIAPVSLIGNAEDRAIIEALSE